MTSTLDKMVSVVIPLGELAHNDSVSRTLALLVKGQGRRMTDLRKSDKLNAQGLEGAVLLELRNVEAHYLINMICERSGPHRAAIRK